MRGPVTQACYCLIQSEVADITPDRKGTDFVYLPTSLNPARFDKHFKYAIFQLELSHPGQGKLAG